MNLDDDDLIEDFDFNDEENDDTGDDWKLKPLREAAAELKILAKQILRTTEAIVETIPDKPEDHTEIDSLTILQEYKGWMMENAFKLQVKLSGAMATCNYILMTENATIIKMAARDLMTQTSGLKMYGYENQDYLDTLRTEIEDYRKVFVKWVRAFPKEEPLWPDGWGLYYTDEDVENWNKLNPDEQQQM